MPLAKEKLFLSVRLENALHTDGSYFYFWKNHFFSFYLRAKPKKKDNERIDVFDFKRFTYKTENAKDSREVIWI